MKFSELEKLLVAWLWTMYDGNIGAIDELIRQEAKAIIEELNQNKLGNKK